MVDRARERAIAELHRMVLEALGEHDAAVWIGAEIEERLAGHAAVLRRWLATLRKHAGDGV